MAFVLLIGITKNRLYTTYAEVSGLKRREEKNADIEETNGFYRKPLLRLLFHMVAVTGG